MFAAALHLLLLVLALPSSALRILPAARCLTRTACNLPRTPCILASDAAGDAAELEDPSLPAPSADDMECEARVVTELKDTVNNASLPDRFMMAMRAMRGEFSPSSGDTERDDGQILEANQIIGYFNYVNRCLNGLGVTTDGDIVGYYAKDE